MGLEDTAVEWVALTAIRENPANPRLNDAAVQPVAASIRRFGWQQPIVASRDGVVIAGNTRLRAARELGLDSVPVVWFEGSDADARAYMIADNRTAEFAEWDERKLGDILSLLKEEDALDGIGYESVDIDRLIAESKFAEQQTTGAEDDVPEPPEEATTRPGDLWILGRHRVLCGDSASVDDVDRLLAGAPIHLVNTDPPYNVKVEPRSNNAIAAGVTSVSRRADLQCERSQSERGKLDRERLAKKRGHHQALDLARRPGASQPTHRKLRAKDRPLANDFVSDEAFAALLRRWFGNIARVLLPGRTFYIWGGYANCGNYPPALKECGLYFAQAIIWVKEHPVLTRKDFMGNHEWSFYGWREGAGHKWFGPHNVTDVWSVKKINPQSMVHLTEKPVELATRAIQYSSQRGENVLDLFGGSGSTLIACEQASRNAFLMEIDLPYSDVIVERWQRFTGKEARLEGGGTFAEERESRREPAHA